MLKRVAFVFASVVVVGMTATSLAFAESNTKSVRGTFSEQAVTSPCTSPIGLCAAGEFKGGLHGTFEITATSATPTSNPDVVLLTTSWVLHTKQGDINGSGQTLLNTVTGYFSSVDSIVGGTGKWAGASGTLQSTGQFNAATGVGEGDYQAVISVP